MPRAGPHLDRLVAVFERLRAPGGCPWDRERTLADLGKYLLEECEEAAAETRRLAKRGGDPGALREELGDLLCNLVFTAQIARERGWFGMDEVAKGAVEKIVRRHPHVFGGARAETAREVEALWRDIKAGERAGRRRGAAARGGARSARSRRSRRS